MTKPFLVLALIISAAQPSITFAQPAPANGAIACRAVKPGETPNATFQNAPILCRRMNVAKVRAAMDKVMVTLTPEQKAKLEFAMKLLQEEMMLEPQYPGYNGNPNN